MTASSLNSLATKRNVRGFSLLELMFTLTVAAILLGVGVPSFVDTIRSNRATTNINELSSAFAIARSEAIRRGANITACRSTDGATCGADWGDGWIVFVDGAATDTAAPVLGEILRVWGPMPGEATITTRANGTVADLSWVRFGPRGGARTGAAMPFSIAVELAGCQGEQLRTLELNTVGRASVARGTC
jgi:type IV fimbrial biogenesis protein FimT